MDGGVLILRECERRQREQLHRAHAGRASSTCHREEKWQPPRGRVERAAAASASRRMATFYQRALSRLGLGALADSTEAAAPSAAPDAVDSPRAVREAFYYPYSCKAAVETYSACMKEPGDWRRCAEMRDAMDSCLEIGERRRFTLDSQCMRWKRKYQACILQGGPEGSCASTIEQLTNCIQEAA